MMRGKEHGSRWVSSLLKIYGYKIWFQEHIVPKIYVVLDQAALWGFLTPNYWVILIRRENSFTGGGQIIRPGQWKQNMLFSSLNSEEHIHFIYCIVLYCIMIF